MEIVSLNQKIDEAGKENTNQNYLPWNVILPYFLPLAAFAPLREIIPI